MSRHVRNRRVFRKSEPALFSDPWDDLIPPDHEVRRLRALLESLDLSFLEAMYDTKGGVAYDPRKMLAVILYGIGDGVRSSRALEEHCRFDNRYRFLLDGQTPDDRSFGRFLERLKDEPEELLRRVLERAKVKLEAVAVDGTKMRASVSRYADPRAGSEATCDPDSARMKDRTGYFFGYNCQLAVDSKTRLVVGLQLTQEAADWNQLIPVLDSVHNLAGHLPKAVVADAGYETSVNAYQCEQMGVVPHLAPNPQAWSGWEVHPGGEVACPEGNVAVPKDQFTANGRRYQRFRVAECRRCPERLSCLGNKTIYRTLTAPVGIDPAARIRNLHRARSDAGLEFQRQRSVLSETPNAQLKHNDGFRQFQRRGLAKARVELMLWAVSYNLRKLMRVILRLLWVIFHPLETQLYPSWLYPSPKRMFPAQTAA